MNHVDEQGTSVRLAMICVAAVDTRLACGALCVTCTHYVQERRQDERRATPRRSRDRRVLSRAL